MVIFEGPARMHGNLTRYEFTQRAVQVYAKAHKIESVLDRLIQVRMSSALREEWNA